MSEGAKIEPDSTAVRTALWRARHLEVDAPPPVFEDALALRLAAPEEGWQGRPDMHPERTRRMRASIVARARFSEELVAEAVERGVGQYVLLGAGLDTFAWRRPELASRLAVFEIDRPGPQEWKRRRLAELGLEAPNARFVPVDFESGESWWDRLVGAGFDPRRPAIVSSTGVAMYLTREATEATLRQVAALAPGSTFAMTFLLTPELLDPEDRRMLEWARQGAAASGTPFATLYRPEELLAMARAAGLADSRHVSGRALAGRYFAGRTDDLASASGEDFLVATT